MAKAQTVPQVRIYRRGRQWWFAINCVDRLKRYFGPETPLEEIDAEALMAFVQWRQSRGTRRLTGYTVNRDLAALRAAWRNA
jgi:hypothetical protein